MSMALFSPSLPPSHLPSLSTATKPHFILKPHFPLLCKRNLVFLSRKASDNGEASAVIVEEVKVEKKEEEGSAVVSEVKVEEKEKEGPAVVSEAKVEEEKKLGSNGVAKIAVKEEVKEEVVKFGEPRWVGGTWDLKQFEKDGKTNWDAVIDAEVRRRKWLEANPESSNNDDPVVFDTSIIPWWSWVKRFHLPEAEILNGRAAMIGFFMAYLVDSLTGVGLVDQMGNFFCKTLLFVAVAGVLLIRKNEDVENIKKLVEETTFYDKQWQATWKDENTGDVKKN